MGFPNRTNGRPAAGEPSDPAAFTARFDRFYTRFAPLYDLLIRVFPVWKRWIEQVIPSIQTGRVLEVSFGTGHLLMQTAGRFELYGLDYNPAMTALAMKKLTKAGLPARLAQGDVAHLPYRDGSFQTILNTMAFSGYPDGAAAAAELARVLAPGGRLAIVDVGCPTNGNLFGRSLARFWEAGGDILRDLNPLFVSLGFSVRHSEIGGFGSVHLYLATKPGGD